MSGRISRDAAASVLKLFRAGTGAGLSDEQLLARFVDRRGEASEAAFAALVGRHGPMVLGVCRRTLMDPHDAEDAFQATFLVLARRAGSVRSRASLASWLHGVARRVSARARAASSRRREVELRAGSLRAEGSGPAPPALDVWDEVERLPQDLRDAVALCYLEGLTHDEAAGRLGWPVGTVRSRLARARRRLRGRLGTDVPSQGLAPWPAAGLASRTAGAAMFGSIRDAAGAGLVSASAASLAREVLTMMIATKLKWAAAALFAAGTLATGVSAYQAGATPAPGTTGRPGTSDDAMAKAEGPPAVGAGTRASRVAALARRAEAREAAGDPEGAAAALAALQEELNTWRGRLPGAQAPAVSTPLDSSPAMPPLPTPGRSPFEQDPPQPSPSLPPPGNAPLLVTPPATAPADPDRRIAELERTVARLVRAIEAGDGREGIRLGHPASTARVPPTARLKGKILEVEPAAGRVEIPFGSDDGLALGRRIKVIRPDPARKTKQLLGVFEVVQLTPDRAVAEPRDPKESGMKVKVGDEFEVIQPHEE